MLATDNRMVLDTNYVLDAVWEKRAGTWKRVHTTGGEYNYRRVRKCTGSSAGAASTGHH